jgi:hypothetical protein
VPVFSFPLFWSVCTADQKSGDDDFSHRNIERKTSQPFNSLKFKKMDQTSSNSSSFEDLAKDNDVKDIKEDEDIMDILGNKQLTKKVCHVQISQHFVCLFMSVLDSGERRT